MLSFQFPQTSEPSSSLTGTGGEVTQCLSVGFIDTMIMGRQRIRRQGGRNDHICW